jgi:hypothetical protein
LNKRSFFEQERCITNDLSFIETIAQFTQVGLQQIGSKNKPCAPCRTHPFYSPDLSPTDFYLFPPVKEKLERVHVADEDQFFESLQEILRGIIKKN